MSKPAEEIVRTKVAFGVDNTYTVECPDCGTCNEGMVEKDSEGIDIECDCGLTMSIDWMDDIRDAQFGKVHPWDIIEAWKEVHMICGNLDPAHFDNMLKDE